MPTYDAIVLGTGGVGSAALFELARRGQRVLGLDRFPTAHDRGSSHGSTRLIRQAYFEHSDYVPLVLRAYERWAELAARRGQTLLHETGLLQIGPARGVVLSGVRASARRHGLFIDELSPAELRARFPQFNAPTPLSGIFERRAGCLLVEECVRAHLEEAIRLGAEHRTGVSARAWRRQGSGVVVDTDAGPFEAARLVIAAGPWTSQVLADLGLPLVVRRKSVFWYEAPPEHFTRAAGFPAFLVEDEAGIFYGFPSFDADGLKVAEHTGGHRVVDPLMVNREIDADEEQRVRMFLQRYLPAVSDTRTRHSVCMYTLSPDEHFIIDRHPACEAVFFCAGLSGHGFKFTSVLGEALADLAVDGHTSLPIEFLSLARLRAVRPNS
ncbi:MAG: N-methyl-L-tryptophan oxidase [Pirellulales bacterium]|nr:N-methyl-L-tryptophan oxidase [Pirellulales bacterium]